MQALPSLAGLSSLSDATLAALRALRDDDRARFFDLGELDARDGMRRLLRFDIERC